jgi:hypothetical protein
MGGIGSGRRDQYGKGTAENSRPLDIRTLHRSGLLKPDRSFWWPWTSNGNTLADVLVRVGVKRVVLSYEHKRRGDSESQNVEQQVALDYTACTYGGTRPWWLCPSCGRRVAVLYGSRGYYACRRCCNLVYTCQRKSADDRATRRADRIRQRLGWGYGVLNPPGGRVKGMHYRTYQRLTHKYNTFAAISLDGIGKRLAIIKATLGGIEENLKLFRKNKG